MTERNEDLYAKWWANINRAKCAPPPASNQGQYFKTVPWCGTGTFNIPLVDIGDPQSQTCRIWVEPWNKQHPLHIAQGPLGTTLCPQVDRQARPCPEMGLQPDAGIVVQYGVWAPDAPVVHQNYGYAVPMAQSGFPDTMGIPPGPPPFPTWSNAATNPINALGEVIDMNNTRAFFLGGYFEVCAHVSENTTVRIQHIAAHKVREAGRSEFSRLPIGDHGHTGAVLGPLCGYPYSDGYRWGETALDDPTMTDYGVTADWFDLGGGDWANDNPVDTVVGQAKVDVKHFSAIPIIPGKQGIMNLSAQNSYGTNRKPSSFACVASQVMYQYPQVGVWYGDVDFDNATMANNGILQSDPLPPPAVLDTTRVRAKCSHHWRESRATAAPVQALLAGYPYSEYIVVGTPANPGNCLLEVRFKMFYQIVTNAQNVNWDMAEFSQSIPRDIGWQSQYAAGQPGVGLTREQAVASMHQRTMQFYPQFYPDTSVEVEFDEKATADAEHTFGPGRVGVQPYVSLRDPDALSKLIFGIKKQKKEVEPPAKRARI